MITVRQRLAVSAFAAVLVVGAVTLALPGGDGKHLTAYFDHTVGVYAGSDLRILGVKVGTVDAVQPQGTKVRVSMTLDGGVPVPADAHALVVAPSVVADRYIQLSPPWTSGPQIADHAEIPVDRTGSPVEIDQLYQSITSLSDALGPTGANADGALSRLLDVGAQNLDGNGQAIGQAISRLGEATRTLSDHRDDLFAMLSELQSFTTMLKNNDDKVRSATEQLATVTGFLADDKQNLGAALQQLATALGQVKTFIQDNRGRLKESVDRLAPITQTLVDQRASLAELLDTAPLAADNVMNAFDAAHGTLDGRADLNELSMGPPLPFPATGTTTQEAGR
ncbi:MCE family protein [Kitasatospora sp. HPMI-4]|uniref:MCE family protein n=1 Tax=Kitasatospora sp. HPMI-4 TaxID=3448443 RepID=UPI003F1C860D